MIRLNSLSNQHGAEQLRVAQSWAGKGWGAFFWPRVGNEVVVVFEEGDPDQPLIVGSVYNAENMPWFPLPVNKQLGGFKSASMHGKVGKHYNAVVFNDEKGQEHLSIHSERCMSLNSEFDKMFHAGRHKGDRVSVANVLTVGNLPGGGGSGGGNGFNEGNPMPEPPPIGVLGLNSVMVYGENMQAACPLNHQLAVGSNLQLCINPFGLAAGVQGVQVPVLLQSLLGSGMGGNMQFTLGTSAQFTLGQSFEISVGPPKIEIHSRYKDHLPVSILCGMLGAAAIAFVIAYSVLGPGAGSHYDPPQDKASSKAAQAAEQPGDKERATLTLVFQVLAEALLAATMAVESAIDKIDWTTDDLQKEFFAVDDSCLKLWVGKDVEAPQGVTSNWWTEWGDLTFGCLGVVAAIEAEILLVGRE